MWKSVIAAVGISNQLSICIRKKNQRKKKDGASKPNVPNQCQVTNIICKAKIKSNFQS